MSRYGINRAKEILYNFNTIAKRMQEAKSARKRLDVHLRKVSANATKERLEALKPMLQEVIAHERELVKNKVIETSKVKELKDKIAALQKENQSLLKKKVIKKSTKQKPNIQKITKSQIKQTIKKKLLLLEDLYEQELSINTEKAAELKDRIKMLKKQLK